MDIADLRRFTSDGCSVIVGSVDGDGAPATCRAVAIAADDELTRMTVYLPVATSHQTIANVATTHRLAVAASQTIDHTTVQFKGSIRGVRLAREEEAALIRSRLSQFADSLQIIGVPRSLTSRLVYWPAYAIEMNIEQIFDQTPGPRAGAQLI